MSNIQDEQIGHLLPYLDASNPECEQALDDLLRAYLESLLFLD